MNQESKYRYQHRTKPMQVIVWAWSRQEADRHIRSIYGQNQWTYMDEVLVSESFGVGL